MGRYCPISQCHMRRIWGNHIPTAAFEPTHTIHPLRHSAYTVGKGKTSTLITLKEWAFRGYSTGWGSRVYLRQSEAVHRSAVGQPSSSSMAPAIMSLPPTKLIFSLHLKSVQFKDITVEGSRPVGAFRRFLLSQNMAGRSKMEQL